MATSINFTTLKEKYDAIDNNLRAATNKLENEEMTRSEWVEIYDASVRKFAGWRRSFLTYMAKFMGWTYNEAAFNFGRYDNLDLYWKYCRETKH